MSTPSTSDVVVAAAARTPIGRGHPEKGYYRETHPVELLGSAYRAVLDRAGIDATLVEAVLAGCVMQFGPQGLNVARNAWLHEGLPVTTSATTLDIQCGSAQHAVNLAAAQIAAGIHDVVLAAGVEHMGRVGFAANDETQTRFGDPLTPQLRRNHDIVGQGLGAELIADEWSLSREDLDALGLRSHERAARATREGRFEQEMIAMETPDGTVVADQGIRADTSLDALAALQPAFRPDGKLTAGNSSQISDGAAAVLLMRADVARAYGVTPRARVIDHTSVGCDPVKMLEGPIPVTARILERNRMVIDDIDLFEVNEAFASVVLAWERAHRPDMERVNVNGGAIALGHPVGSTGARLVTSLVNELERSDRELGLVTMCCGGGLGTGTLVGRL